MWQCSSSHYMYYFHIMIWRQPTTLAHITPHTLTHRRWLMLSASHPSSERVVSFAHILIHTAEQIWLKFNNDYDLEKFLPSKTTHIAHKLLAFRRTQHTHTRARYTQFSFWVLLMHRGIAFPHPTRCQIIKFHDIGCYTVAQWSSHSRSSPGSDVWHSIRIAAPRHICALTIAVYESNVTEMFAIVFRFMYFKYDLLACRMRVRVQSRGLQLKAMCSSSTTGLA